MQVKEIIKRKLEYISPDTPLDEAARLMKSKNVGALPVFEKDKEVGFITDRDIAIRAVAQDKDPRTTMAREVMTQHCVNCPEDFTLEKAAQLMGEKNVRRLIVVDKANKPVGLISLGDLAANLPRSSSFQGTVRKLKQAEKSTVA
ncbi:MAG: CBS domain-containing protein [Deltaproteobacteria bacterium]|nr:CBS domain-containing protein [Deltaproteobacteria bacterium]MDZ4224312.1 CBS domain-containing protein [bacterium]